MSTFFTSEKGGKPTSTMIAQMLEMATEPGGLPPAVITMAASLIASGRRKADEDILRACPPEQHGLLISYLAHAPNTRIQLINAQLQCMSHGRGDRP